MIKDTSVVTATAPIVKSTTAELATAQNPKRKRHLTTSFMVDEAIMKLGERKGSSLYAIQKYIAKNFDVDVRKLDKHIKNYIRKAFAEGKIVQRKNTTCMLNNRIRLADMPKKTAAEKGPE